MKFFIIFTVIIFFPFTLSCQFDEKKIYKIEKISEEPIIDGNINEKLWQNLIIANNFTQITPKNGKKERNKMLC